MPGHGDYDLQMQKWFCGYWMTQKEWEDVHDYAPAITEKEQSEDEFQG